ncbi:MAG TPA: fibronectin type III domain-containing protein, partial [Verrucomicrobiae bacterium]|nr:fibronectin type III domain-containing protein [Verrucomicrobiae bacterium]
DTTAIVRYGTNAALSLAATNLILELSHAIALGDLLEGATYQFVVVSADEAGNVATNDNNGNFFGFVAAPAKNVLLVNAYTPDDPILGTVEIPLAAYTGPLDQTGISYEVWEVSDRGSPTAADLRPFRAVIWRYNDNPLSQDTIDLSGQNALQTYVNGGGALFLSGMEILTRLGNVAFRTNVLQVQAFVEDAGVPFAEGQPNDTISSGMVLDLDYTVFDSELLQLIGQSPDVSDTLTISSNAVPIFLDGASGAIAGLRYPRTITDTGGRVVFLSFPLDAVSESAPAPDNRANLLRNAISFLAPGLNGLGSIALDSPAYTLPSLVTIEVGDSDLAGQGQTTVKVSSDTATNGVTATLTETPRRGVFRGFITLVSAPIGPASAGELPARDGDSIHAEYFDASANSVAHAAAVVDTVAPAITNVVVLPDYESAEISWETSEFTDALVQFGESPFLERTAYNSEPGDLHSVTLTGLRPDRIYYYQVVSRDTAGNATVDNNQGQLYTFRTLRPIVPPWLDDLNNSGTNWTVFDGDGTQVSWQLGVPNNGQETEAHSPPKAWGSNLNGDVIDYVESFLISPAIELTGGNVATLRFWHSYDFLDFDAILDFGELLIVTNSVSEPVALAQYFDDVASWSEEEFDLTPHVGRVVFLVWHYVYFTLEPAARPGWLIDDVSVTVSSAVRGTIEVTNNLSQARFTVSGPASQTGQGLTLTLTNVPLGEYVVTWSSVLDYQTPPPQTNVVSSAAPLTFQGVYAFVDANSNGMPDAYEQRVFGDVSPTRTVTSDTDSDGQSDYAEFNAGTDPTSTNSVFKVSAPAPQTNGSLRFSWASVPGRAYRLQAGTDLVNWAPQTDWIHATSATSSVVLTPASGGADSFYRLEVRP